MALISYHHFITDKVKRFRHKFKSYGYNWFRGLTVMTADSDSASEGSTPSETFLLDFLLLFL